jgi:hypothetical protein
MLQVGAAGKDRWMDGWMDGRTDINEVTFKPLNAIVHVRL